MTEQILFTAMPKGLVSEDAGSGDPSTSVEVSVLVSPRLLSAQAEPTLDEFPAMLAWTSNLVASPLTLTFATPLGSVDRTIDTGELQPELWAAMFGPETFVRPHRFVDHSGRAVLSFNNRFALSAIKGIYQAAGIDLALPERRAVERGEQDEREEQIERTGSRHRERLRELLTGMAVDWNHTRGGRLRLWAREAARSGSYFPLDYATRGLNPDGTIATLPAEPAGAFLRARTAEQFAVVNHMPQGAPLAQKPPEFATMVDFHQALTSLSSYPELLRPLGLVFDIHLPRSLFQQAVGVETGILRVVGVQGEDWMSDVVVPPDLRCPATTYLHVTGEDGSTFFGTAPADIDDPDVLGLLDLRPERFGIAQVDLDGALHKTIALAERWHGTSEPPPSVHPEVFDETTTLPSLRSGGLSLFADGRARTVMRRFGRARELEEALHDDQKPLAELSIEDLVHGYRLDLWDSHTGEWHSLHRRNATFEIGAHTRSFDDTEGFIQLGATQAAPGADPGDAGDAGGPDLYLHEAIARWAGWSLSVEPPGRHLASDPDPQKALDDEATTDSDFPFPMTTGFDVVGGSLPSLRFGRSYRLRARVVDLCGNGLDHDDALAGTFADPASDARPGSPGRRGFALPGEGRSFPYLRYEPVAAPAVIAVDETAVTGAGSSLERLVMRTFNSDESLDSVPADVTGADRHLVPPRVSVELAERLSMFDSGGSLDGTAAMYELIRERDAGQIPEHTVEIAGQETSFPMEAGPSAAIPYLPDVMARGVALRDLPGTPSGSIGTVDPAAPAGAVAHAALVDPNPRPGSATLVGFGGDRDWQEMRSIRLALTGSAGEAHGPHWDPATRTLTVALPAGFTSQVSLSSYLTATDLKLMGVWRWISEEIDRRGAASSDDIDLPGSDASDRAIDRVAHVIQRSLEGGHWMLTPPTVLTLVHATQQPLGRPAFRAISVQHEPYGESHLPPYDETRNPSPWVLQTTPERSPTGHGELATITAWRYPGATDAYLLGGLAVHAASTEKVDITATWEDPVDDPSIDGRPVETTESHAADVDEIPIRRVDEGLIAVNIGTPNERSVGYYDPDHDLVCFVRAGDSLGHLISSDPDQYRRIWSDAAPRHQLGDGKHHRIKYSAVATSRFRDYFDPDQPGGFTRTGESVQVDVPASRRPDAPRVAYVVPTFGWQRRTEADVKRTVRFGGGLRVYLERGWFSSGAGELLGVTTWSWTNQSVEGDLLERAAPHVTQWGADPVWHTAPLPEQMPRVRHLRGEVAAEEGLSLDAPGDLRADVAGFEVHFDEERDLWYADITVDTESDTYSPFVRLGLARYQPHAIPDAKLSSVVLADFAQLTPSRSVSVTADPHRRGRLRVSVGGIAPDGPVPTYVGAAAGTRPRPSAPTVVTVTVQRRRDGTTASAASDDDLGWVTVSAPEVAVAQVQVSPMPPTLRWTGTVDLNVRALPRRYRLVISEHEYISANHLITDLDDTVDPPTPIKVHPRRLVFAETMEIDTALLSGPVAPQGTVV